MTWFWVPDAAVSVGTVTKGPVLGNQGVESPKVVTSSILLPLLVQELGQGSRGISLLLGEVLDSNQSHQGVGSTVAVAHGIHKHLNHRVCCGVLHVLLYRLCLRFRA